MSETLIRKPREGRSVILGGDVYCFKATGAETGGAYMLMEAFVPPGGGPPPHTHGREDEAFYILDGHITFHTAGTSVTLGPGGFIHCPRGREHRFQNQTASPARMLIQCTPAGIEAMFLELGRPAAGPEGPTSPPTSEDIRRLLEAAPRYGISINAPG